MAQAAPVDPLYGDLRANWKWMLALGLLMIVLGVVGLGMTTWLTILSVMWFGVLSVIGGVAQLVDAFKCSGWRSVLAHVALGIVYMLAGVVLIVMPVQSAWWLTLFLGAVFVITGLLRIFQGWQMRGPGSGAIFLILTGILSVALGVMIYVIVDLPPPEALTSLEGIEGWFAEWGWVIGLFVALEFIVHGASLAALAIAAKRGDVRTGDGPLSPTAPPGASA